MKCYQSQKKLRILTFNTAGVPIVERNIKKRYQLIAEGLNDQGFDIINFQEVHLYPFLHILRTRLTHFPYVSFQKTLFGPKGGLVTFSTIPPQGFAYYAFPDFKTKSIYEKLLLIKAGNRGFTTLFLPGWIVINTHLAANLGLTWDTKSFFHQIQIRQIDFLVKAITTIKNQAVIILTGDFNIAKNTIEFTLLREKLSLQEVFSDNTFSTYNHKFLRDLSEKSTKIHIDHIFTSLDANGIVSKGVFFDKEIFGQKKPQFYVSDHIALFTTLRHVEPTH